MEVKAGFRDPEKCSFPLKEMSLLTKVTNKKVMYVNIFLGLPLNFPFNSDVIDIRLNSNESYNNYKLQSIY